jgi:AcrR family transcriptional regulator
MVENAEETSTRSPTLAAGRRPAQKRSQARVGALLDAADSLLQTRDINEISLYDVAHAAGVPPTSAYHFFPTKESVFLALAERYLRKMHAALDAPMDLTGIERWQDLVALRYNRVVDYFNASLCARKLFMGTALLSDIKTLDFQDMDNSAEGYYRLMDRYFDMPYVRDPAFKFSVTFAIHDGVWATSYAKHGHITQEFAREGLRAALAYLSTFLPETIAMRAPTAEEPAAALEPPAGVAATKRSGKAGRRKAPSAGRRAAGG